MKLLKGFFPWIMLIIFSVAIVFLLLKLSKNKKLDKSTNVISATINEIKDAAGEQRAVIATKVKGDTSDFDKAQIQRLRKALELERKDKILAITEIEGTLRDSIKLLAINLDAEKHKVWNWEKKYASGSTITATMSEKDSVLIPSVDVKTEVADVETGSGRDKKFYTEFYTPDQNITFNGAKTFRVEHKEIKDLIQADFKLGFRKDLTDGSRDRLEGTVQTLFFPDNNITVGVGAGAVYILPETKFSPFAEIFIRQNLFKIRNRK